MDAFQCDRCKQFFTDISLKTELTQDNDDFDLCEGCSDAFDMFMTGAPLAVKKKVFPEKITVKAKKLSTTIPGASELAEALLPLMDNS